MKAGNENPARSSTTPVISSRQSMPGVQMPGERTRKAPTGKAGQDVAGEANQVKITHGSKSPGRQTWKGSAEGYTSRSTPAYSPAEVGGNTQSSGNHAKQSVKGVRGKSAPAEGKQVAGQFGVSKS